MAGIGGDTLDIIMQHLSNDPHRVLPLKTADVNVSNHKNSRRSPPSLFQVTTVDTVENEAGHRAGEASAIHTPSENLWVQGAHTSEM